MPDKWVIDRRCQFCKAKRSHMWVSTFSPPYSTLITIKFRCTGCRAIKKYSLPKEKGLLPKGEIDQYLV